MKTCNGVWAAFTAIKSQLSFYEERRFTMALAKYYEDNYEIAEQRYLAYLEEKGLFRSTLPPYLTDNNKLYEKEIYHA